MKKAQVTIFIILAIGVIVIIGLLVALRGTGKQEPAVNYAPDVEPVVTFVEQCLQESTMAGLRLLGAQGGVIYEHQGGFVPDSFADERFTWEHNGHHIWYSIRPDSVTYGRSCAAEDLGEDFDYQSCPSITFPFYSEDSDRIMFGNDGTSKSAHTINGSLVSNMRLLNRLSLPGLYEREGPQSEVAWIQPLLSPHMKIRPNLAEFIKNNVSACLNFSELARRNLNVELKAPMDQMEVNPEFSEEFTKVSISLPMRVVDNRTGQSTFLDDFSVSTKVRFGKIYKYVNDILRKEAEDYSFDLSSAETYDGIGLEKLDRDSYKREVDIVVFVDQKSFITNQTTVENYRFFGAIPNSPPAISYIHYSNLAAVPGLAGFLRANCGFDDTPQGLNVLAKQVFGHMNKHVIECIFSAYANVTKLQGTYQPAYDPDDDELEWSYRTSNCGWDQPCQYDSEAEFDSGMSSQLVLRFYEKDNPQYNDTLVIPLRLYNYAPSSITAECLGSHFGTYVYEVKAANRETGPNKDELTLLPPEVVQGDVDIESYEEYDVTRGHMSWLVRFSNTSGTHKVKFTVEDTFGARNSSVLPIQIPC